MKEDLSSVVHMFQKHQHLMAPDAISRKEQNVRSEVWVVTTDLHNDLFDTNFQQSVRANLSREIEYIYFVEESEYLRQRKLKYTKMYREFNKFWRFVTLPAGVFMPFDEVVIYDARSVGQVWGYAQMKYVVEGRQSDDLFLKLPDRNVVDMARSLKLLLERDEGNR
jgi:hypothetical protein